jgi:putative membrane protein
MGWKMIVIVASCAFTMMGVEHIAAQVEMPFGTYVPPSWFGLADGSDPCDLNLDLF